jgi:hypothetical protein
MFIAAIYNSQAMENVVFNTMEFFSATKKNEILSFASKWIEMENIILSKVSQAQKSKNHVFSFIG